MDPLEDPITGGDSEPRDASFASWEYAARSRSSSSGRTQAWRLDQNGYGNPYYSAAAAKACSRVRGEFLLRLVRSGGFVTVDKPPVALWIQAVRPGYWA